MRVGELLEDLRRKDVRLKVDGLTLLVDAPSEVDAEGLAEILREHKRALIRLIEQERHKLEGGDCRGLVIRFARERGYLSVHDPTTGDWHELQASGCPPWMLEDAKAHHRRRRRGRTNR
jgi:hypothetical protein